MVDGDAEWQRNLVEKMGCENAGVIAIDRLTVLSMQPDVGCNMQCWSDVATGKARKAIEPVRATSNQNQNEIGCVESLLAIMAKANAGELQVLEMRSMAVTMKLESELAQVQWHNTYMQMGDMLVAWRMATHWVHTWSRYSNAGKINLVAAAPLVVTVGSVQLKGRNKRDLPGKEVWKSIESRARSKLGAICDPSGGIDTTTHLQESLFDRASLLVASDYEGPDERVMGQEAGLDDTGEALLIRLQGAENVTTLKSELHRGTIERSDKRPAARRKEFNCSLWAASRAFQTPTPKVVLDQSGVKDLDFLPPTNASIASVHDETKMPLIYEAAACFAWMSPSDSYVDVHDAFLY